MVGQKASRTYDGFPDLSSCWEQTKHHKKHFLDHLDCKYRQLYHQLDCKRFDDVVENIAGGKTYRDSFFNFYKILGPKPELKKYTNGPVTNKSVIEQLATSIHIIKKSKNEINMEKLPEDFYLWPGHFTLESVKAFIFEEDREEIQTSIVNCIKRRTMFRNTCVKDCNRLIDTRSHDVFLLILQVLYARNIYYNNCKVH